MAGSEILAAYPFAPVAPHCPVSIALYGYRDSLYVGLDADTTAMPDLGAFEDMLSAVVSRALAPSAQRCRIVRARVDTRAILAPLLD